MTENEARNFISTASLECRKFHYMEKGKKT